MLNDEIARLSCELTPAAKSDLRRAIGLILFIGAASISPPSGAQTTTLDPVQVVGVRYSDGDWYDSGWYFDGTSSYSTPFYAEGSDFTSIASDPEPKVLCDNPVDIITGAKYQKETDFASASDDGLRLDRIYNAAWFGYGIFSNNGGIWTSNFDLKLQSADCYPVSGGNPWVNSCELNSPVELFAHREDGDVIRFVYDSLSTTWRGSEEAPLAKIVKQADGTYKLTWPDGSFDIYSSYGFILQRKKADSVGLTFTYDASKKLTRVTHTSGRFITFVYNGTNLVQVIDPSGAVYNYGYTLGSMNQVNFPDGKGNVTYHFESSGFQLLTGISINGVRFSRYVFDGSGRVTQSQKENGADLKTYAYFEGRTERTNSLGLKTVYTIANGKITDVTGYATANCPASFSSKTFDAEGRPNIVVDAKGNATDFDYDTNGWVSKIVEGVGTANARTTTKEWNSSTGQLIKSTVLGANETSYSYDSASRVTSVSVKNLMANTPAVTLTTTITYSTHPNGLIATKVVDGPLPGSGDATTYAYSGTGELTSIANSLGHTTTFSNYNALGEVGRVVDPNGATADYTYDVRGRLLTAKPIVNGVAQTTAYTYDAWGRLATVQMPDGQLRKLAYDAADRLISETEPEPASRNAQRVYLYNTNSQPVQIVTRRTSP